jgi:3-phosphoglycerate kinase
VSDKLAVIDALLPKVDRLLVGGGASLEYLEGKTLPGLAVLDLPPPRLW